MASGRPRRRKVDGVGFFERGEGKGVIENADGILDGAEVKRAAACGECTDSGFVCEILAYFHAIKKAVRAQAR